MASGLIPQAGFTAAESLSLEVLLELAWAACVTGRERAREGMDHGGHGTYQGTIAWALGRARTSRSLDLYGHRTRCVCVPHCRKGRRGRAAMGRTERALTCTRVPMALLAPAAFRHLLNISFLSLRVWESKRVTESFLKVIVKITEANGFKALGRTFHKMVADAII